MPKMIFHQNFYKSSQNYYKSLKFQIFLILIHRLKIVQNINKPLNNYKPLKNLKNAKTSSKVFFYAKTLAKNKNF